MTYTRVQDGTTQALTATGGSPSSYTGLASAGTVGHLVIFYAGLSTNVGSVSAVVGNTSTAFNQVFLEVNSTASGTRKNAAWIAWKVVQSGDDLTSLAITPDVSCTIRCTAQTWNPGTGFHVPTSPVDKFTSQNGGNTSATSVATGTTAATTLANGLGVAMVGFNAGTGSTAQSWSNSWSQNGFQGNAAFFADKVDLGATGTQTTTLTLTGATARWWSAGIVAFLPPEADAAGVGIPFRRKDGLFRPMLSDDPWALPPGGWRG